MPFPTNPITGSTGGPGEPPPPPPNDCEYPPCCPETGDCCTSTDPDCPCPEPADESSGMGGQCCMNNSGNSAGPIGYGTGQIVMTVTDLPSRGYGLPWGHVRSYSNQLQVDGTTTSVDYGNGYNWMLRQTAYLLNPNGDESEIGVVISPRHAYSFTLVGGNYVGAFGALQTLVHDATNQVFRLIQTDGTVWEFHDFDQTANPPGLLAGVVTRGDRSLTLLYPDAVSQVSEVQRSFTDPDGVTTVESFLYAYVAEPDENAGHIESVTLRRNIDDSGWNYVRRAVFSYYRSDSAGGDVGDLESSVHQLPAGLDSWADIGTYYYRYYRDSAGGVGFAHGLKFVLEPAAFQRLSAGVGDPRLAADAQVSQYADYYFEYDEGQRVSLETVAGGTRTYRFEYTDSGNAIGYNSWQRKTVETLPDGNRNIVYTNHINQVMLKELRSESESWIEYRQYDETLGSEILYANPSAVQGYDDTQADLGGPSTIVKASDGLVELTEYYTSTTATPTTAGGVTGYRRYDKISQGLTGSPIKLLERTYFQRNSTDDDPSAAPVTIYPVATVTKYQSDTGGGSDPSTTGYEYTWHVGTVQVLQRTTQLPTVSTDQNGSGADTFRRMRYDDYGKLIWEQGPKGFIDHFAYDLVTGATTEYIRDVDPTELTIPSGWTRPSGLPAPLQLVTDYEADDRGRRTQTLGPVHDVNGRNVRTAAWTVYLDGRFERRSARGYAVVRGASYDYVLVNPVSITRTDAGGATLDEIQAARGCACGSPVDAPTESSGRLSEMECFPQSTWTAWTHHELDHAGRLVAGRAYHTIPLCGAGEKGAHYDETLYGYDVMSRRNRVVSPGGTITRTVFDPRNRSTATWVGTSDAGATDLDPGGGTYPPVRLPRLANNMVPVSARTFSSSCGCSEPSTITQFVDDDSANDRVTTFTLDFRNRVTDIAGEENYYERRTYDNLNRVVQVDRFDGPPNHPTTPTNFVASGKTYFDDQGNVYRRERYGISSGTVQTNKLTENNWYDAAGNLVKQSPMGAQEGRAFTKYSYDGDARQTASYQGYYTGTMPESYADALTITSSNKIFEQTISTFDNAGSLIASAFYQRFHDATGSGVLNLPDGSQPKARVSYSSTWFDGIGRSVAIANYGTNGNVAWTRPESVPERSDSVLVTTLGYDSAGNHVQTIDPAGRERRGVFNALGAAVLAVSNYVEVSQASQISTCEDEAFCSDVPTASWTQCFTAGNAENVAVGYAYNADGNLVALTAYNPSTGDQETRYEYGVTLAEGPIASNDFLRSAVYPDTIDSGDRVTNGFNRQGQVTSTTDQNGTRHLYDYDGLGRLTADRIDEFGTGIDDNVIEIATAYNSHGLVASVTSLDDADAVVNQVTRTYNAFDQLVLEAQSHSGVVVSGTPKVQYSYADASVMPSPTNTVRPLTVTYPDGRVITYGYGSSGGDNDRLSRVTNIDDSSGQRVAYTYLGLSTFVRANYPEPEVRWDLVTGSSPNPYAGLDRFGRVIDCLWQDYGSNVDAERVQYGYNRVGNRIWRKNTVASGGNDELYVNDGLQRLIDMGRGDLVDGDTALDEVSFGQNWNLDATGNWSGFRQLNSATPTENLDQQRSANAVNEITDITRRYGLAWTTPAYDRAGNTTSFPKPADPTTSFQATYDAWNRLVRLEDGETAVGEYHYDGLNRRVTATDDEAVVRHAYYSQDWRLIEERLADDTDAEQQFLWGLRYIDDLVLRDRDTDGNGSLDERLYALQDANWNVTAIVDAGGDVQERYRYSAYGTPTFLNADFAPQSAVISAYRWETLFAGSRRNQITYLYQMRNRYLDSLSGRWLTRDKLQYIAEYSLYQYGESSPTIFTDPLGLAASVSFTPESPVNAPWYSVTIPQPAVGKAVAGLTKAQIESFEYDCTECPDTCNQYELNIKIQVSFAIEIDVHQVVIIRAGTKNQDFTVPNVYGHEQQHIISLMQIWRQIVSRTNITLKPMQCKMDQDTCMQTGKETSDEILQEWQRLDATDKAHMAHESPEEGLPLPPLLKQFPKPMFK